MVVRKQIKNILTNEDWYPTLEGKVYVSVLEWDDGQCKVTVAGGDDYFLEKLFTEWATALREFDRVVNLTTVAELGSRGFQ